MVAAGSREEFLAKEALESTEKMCSDRGIRCEKMLLSRKSPLHGALEVAEEKQCDVIVTSIQPHWLAKPVFDVKQTTANGQSGIPILFHRAA